MADDKYKFEDIFDKLGIGDLPAEEKEKMFQEMNETIDAAVTLKVGRMLSDEERKAFDELQTDEEHQKFLEERGIDLMAISLQEAINLRERLLADVNYVTGKMEERKKQEMSGTNQGNQ